jgi:L-ascorbate metabolism protein UlaG (beta-lactamase superfamily)
MSDHFDGRQFFNPTAPAQQPVAAVPRMLREARKPWPASIPVAPQRPPALDGAAAVCTFIGHSTFLVQSGPLTFLTDPMFSERAGPLNAFGPRRVREPAVRLDDLPRVDVVLLSHNHYDHCDLPTLRRLARRFDPIVVTPLGNARLVRRAGLRRVHELDWWQEVEIGAASIHATRAHHFSARTPFDRNRALWGGFVVSAGGVRIYFAGDTAYAPIFSGIRERCGPIDLALLPIGAYEPRWFMHAVHMNPAEAVQAHCELAPAQSLGMHFGTFQLTTEAIDAPLEALDEARRAQGVAASAFRAPAFGESIRVEHRP